MSNEKIVLYSYWRSSCSYRVRIALNLKLLNYDYIPVNLKTGEQLNHEFSSKNPMGQLPALLIDDMLLTQSLPIMEYLEETRRFSGSRLLPDDPQERAKVRCLSELVNSGIQPVQNLAVLKRIVGIRKEYEGNFDNETKVKYFGTWSKKTIETGFTALEHFLTGTAKSFCVGNSVSMADVCLVPQVYNAVRYKVDMSKYPNIQRINNKCLQLKAFQDAHPSKMMDAVPPPKSKL